MNYIPADKLKAEIKRLKEKAQAERVLHPQTILSAKNYLLIKDYDALLSIITSLQKEQPFPRWIHANYSDKPEIRYTPSGIPYLQNGTYMIWLSDLDTLPKDGTDLTNPMQEQPANMIQWTGSNLQEVIDFTGKSPKFGEWFKSWDEFESYVHSHGDILKLFSEDGSHFEVSVGAWIVKTPDGHNVPSVARFIHAKQEQPEVDLEK